MNKKLAFLLIATGISFATQSYPFFDNLFKGVDFDKLAKDIEGMLEKNETTKGIKAPKSPFQQTLRHPASKNVNQTIITQPKINMDKKALFLDSIAIEKASGGKSAQYEFPQAKIKSFHEHVELFIDELKLLERSADSAKIFSTEFRERFFSHKKEIDSIIVALGFISDRKFYIRAFFLKQFENLREKVVKAINGLKKINQRISLESRESDEEHDTSIDQLQKRLKFQKKAQSRLSDTPQKPLSKKKKFHRGKRLPEQRSINGR